MSVPLSYAIVIIVWSTTPLGVAWSNDSLTPITAVFSRMFLAFVLAVMLAAMIKQLRLDFSAHWKVYAAAGFGLFPNMPLVYWAAEYIPSGLISVIFGLSPFFIALLSQRLLNEDKLSVSKWLALCLAVLGLLIIFSDQIRLGPNAIFGITLMIIAVFLFSLSGVLVKKFHSGAQPLQQLNGSLLFSLPGFFICWFFIDGQIPTEVSDKSFYAIIYLAVIGSLVGFVAYFYLLGKLPVAKVGLIPLITPGLAVMIGAYINDEPLTQEVILGSVLIVAGLAFFQKASLVKSYR